MRLCGLHLGTPKDYDLACLRAAAPSYSHVGSTLRTRKVPGVRRLEAQAVVGIGEDEFARVRAELRAWRPQRSLAATVTPDDVAPDLGETVLLGLGLGPVRLVVPNRIVAVIDESDRYGYAYGTLPGHPERGEELFLLDLHHDGSVVLTIRTDSEPAEALRRLARLIRPLQRAAIHRYLSAVTIRTVDS